MESLANTGKGEKKKNPGEQMGGLERWPLRDGQSLEMLELAMDVRYPHVEEAPWPRAGVTSLGPTLHLARHVMGGLGRVLSLPSSALHRRCSMWTTDFSVGGPQKERPLPLYSAPMNI
jgi:hypothetical protein